MKKPKRLLTGTKPEKVSWVLWQGKGECHCCRSPGRADSLLFHQQWPSCFSMTLLKVALTILAAPILASTSSATDTHPRASPMSLAAPKKDFPPGLPKFPFPILLYAHGMDSQVVAGIYTKPACEHRTRMSSSFLPLTHCLSESTQIFVQFLMHKNLCQV